MENFCSQAAECGHRSFVIMAGALDQMKVKARKLSYEGPFGVGYGVCVYETEGRDPQRDFLDQYEEKERSAARKRKQSEDDYVRLARQTIETYVKTGKRYRFPRDFRQKCMRRGREFSSP